MVLSPSQLELGLRKSWLGQLHKLEHKLAPLPLSPQQELELPCSCIAAEVHMLVERRSLALLEPFPRPEQTFLQRLVQCMHTLAEQPRQFRTALHM